MTYRLRNIILAVVLAVLAAFLTALYVANYQNRLEAGQEKVKVFVAKTDIPPGTPAASLEGKIEQKEILSKNVVPVAVLDKDDLEGQTTSQWIYSGEQISARRFNTSGRTGIHAELKGNFRAFAVAGEKEQLLAGIVKTGDHVDVIGHFGVASRVYLRDIQVLRAPESGDVSSKIANSASGGGYSIVLKLTDSQAQKLFFLTSEVVDGDLDWWLDLRAPADATDGPESLTTINSAITDGLPASLLGRARQGIESEQQNGGR